MPGLASSPVVAFCNGEFLTHAHRFRALGCPLGSPRIDREECGLLDAANCQAMFCHSDWYRDLIARNRGPANTAPIVT